MSEAEPANPPTTPARTPDPGSRPAALIAMVVGLAALVAVFLAQQSSTAPTPTEQPAAELPPTDPMFDMSSRIMLKVAHAFGRDPVLVESFRSQLAGQARTETDRLRLVITEGELAGADAALDLLDERAATESEELERDAELLRTLYSRGSEAIAEENRDHLVSRYAWLGEVALTFDQDTLSPERNELLRGGTAVILTTTAMMFLVATALLTGLVLFIVFVVKLNTGTLRASFTRPAPGGSVYLEIVTVFIVGFLLLKLIAAPIPPVLSIALQWSLLGVVLWPILRAVPARDAFRDLGLHTGRGLFREIGAGFVGYLAGIPLIATAVLITLVLVLIQGMLQGLPGEPAPPPSNPIIEIVQNAGVIELVLLYTLATIWAPLAEEIVFRGALYRHLRSRTPVLISAILSAAVFGAMHGYEWILLLPVTTIGLVFALIREWRGSLIGPIFAHALHNATVLGIVIVLMRSIA